MNTQDAVAAQAVIKTLEYIEHLAQSEEGLAQLNQSTMGMCQVMFDAMYELFGDGDNLTPEYTAGRSLWNDTNRGLFEEWPEFSGSTTYPVRVRPFSNPRLVGNEHATDNGAEEWCESAGSQFNNSNIMFSYNTEYGRARLRLVAYLRERYQQAIDGVRPLPGV